MNWLVTVLAKLNGVKTYIAAVAGILTALVAYLNGALDVKGLLEAVWAGIVAMTIRHGITTTTTPTK